MNKVYIARGYNSWTSKELLRAFKTEKEAEGFIQGLTDPKIQIFSYKSTIDLVNSLLVKG